MYTTSYIPYQNIYNNLLYNTSNLPDHNPPIKVEYITTPPGSINHIQYIISYLITSLYTIHNLHNNPLYNLHNLHNKPLYNISNLPNNAVHVVPSDAEHCCNYDSRLFHVQRNVGDISDQHFYLLSVTDSSSIGLVVNYSLYIYIYIYIYISILQLLLSSLLTLIHLQGWLYSRWFRKIPRSVFRYFIQIWVSMPSDIQALRKNVSYDYIAVVKLLIYSDLHWLC